MRKNRTLLRPYLPLPSPLPSTMTVTNERDHTAKWWINKWKINIMRTHYSSTTRTIGERGGQFVIANTLFRPRVRREWVSSHWIRPSVCVRYTSTFQAIDTIFSVEIDGMTLSNAMYRTCDHLNGILMVLVADMPRSPECIDGEKNKHSPRNNRRLTAVNNNNNKISIKHPSICDSEPMFTDSIHWLCVVRAHACTRAFARFGLQSTSSPPNASRIDFDLLQEIADE